VPSAENRANQIDRIKRLEKQQPGRLPGENERALQPECKRDQNVSQVTKVKEILQSVLPPVNRHPDQQPESPGNFEPKRQAHARHCIQLQELVCPLNRRREALFAYDLGNLLMSIGVPTMPI
jgi:hypothetical protein